MRTGPLANALVAVFCLLAACPVHAQQAGPADAGRVEVVARKGEVSSWFRAESRHFVVYSDARQEDVSALLDNLEKLDHLLRIYALPVRQAEQQEPKLTLYHHSRASDLREVADSAPADAVGLYSSCASGVQGFGLHLERIPSLGDEQLEKAPLNETLSSAFEAYARHFLYRHTDIRTPEWFIEGFAQYFSSVRFSEQQMVVGRAPGPLARYLNFLDNGRKYSLDYADVLEHKLANARNYGGAAGVRLEFQAKSWQLAHYMLSSDDKRKRLNRYLVLVGRGMAPTTALERSFDLQVSDLDKLMWRYSRQGVEVLRVAPPSLPVARVSFRNLPRATGDFVLADAALKACPGREAGEALLKKVAALSARSPGDDLARLTLSRAQIGWGNAEDALAPLDAVVRGDAAHVEARYLLGLAHLRVAGRSEGDAKRSHLQAAQLHLRRARELNPRDPQVAFAAFQAEVAATDEPGSAVLTGVISAWQAAREVDALTRSAALAYAYAGNADEAYRTLGPLAQNPRDEPMARWAKQWQSRLETGVSRGDILAEMRRTPATDAPFQEWTLDQERVMQKVARAYGMEAAEPVIREMQRQSVGAPAQEMQRQGAGRP
jgi:hypothetical protein